MKILAHRDNKGILVNYTFLMMDYKYLLNQKPEIYYVCIKRESCTKKLIIGSMKPSNFLSTL